jgi:DNA transposition AAA+ family ATPase
MSEQAQQPTNDFIVTKQYRRFAEFCDACRRYRYIGLCYGPRGVGKTLSARHYAQWDLFEAQLPRKMVQYPPPELIPLRILLYTSSVTTTVVCQNTVLGQIKCACLLGGGGALVVECSQ